LYIISVFCSLFVILKYLSKKLFVGIFKIKQD
jgi:hypothetical protein